MRYQGDSERPSDRFDSRSGSTFFDSSRRQSLPLRAILLAFIVTLGIAGGWFLAARDAGPALVTKVSSEEIQEALTTLSPQAIQEAKSDPRECRIPMGFIIASTPGNPAGGTVRFRTGRYESPPFVITDKPQRIAIPNPIPEGGVEFLTVEGEAKGLVLALTPATKMEPVGGTATTRVIFPASPPCKS
jgi:hypothetical protein